jgi:hypothetical protein
LCFSIDQQNLSIAKIDKVKAGNVGTRNTCSAVGDNIKMLENIRCAELFKRPAPFFVIGCVIKTFAVNCALVAWLVRCHE